MMQDLQYAIRQFRRSPAVMTVALLALALGVGATTTVFTIVNAVLIRPLPFDRAHELYRITKRSPSGTDQWLSVPEFSRWEQATRWATLAGFTPMDYNLRGDRPEGLLVIWASRQFLPVLGITPVLGRAFVEADFYPASERAALITHQMWQRRHAGDPTIVGSSVDLEGPEFLSDSSGRYTIVGVLPESFWLFYSRTDFVVPMRAAAAQLNDPNRRLVATVLARLTDPVPNLVREELTVISSEFERDRPLAKAAPHMGIEVTPLREWHLGDVERPLTFLMAAVVLVALAASANVALVLIARTAHRRREFAIRVASGAGRARIVRQLLTESLLLAALGGVVGVLLAVAATRTAATLIPSHVIGRLPGGADALTLDSRVLFAALLASLILGVAAGLGSCSAFRLRRAFEALRDASFGGQPAGQHALQASLVVLQTGVAVVLLVIGGLLAQSLVRANSVDLGIAPREGLVLWLNLNPSRYSDAEGRARFYQQVFERLRGEPEVAHASGVDLPFYFEWQTARVAAPHTTEPDPDRWPEALTRAVTPAYFERHGIRVVAGRSLTELDDARATPVAVISQALANRYWPGGDAVGQQVRIRHSGSPPVNATVVGIVSNIRSAPHAQPQAIVYRPVQQTPPPWMYITVEGDMRRADLLAAVRRAVWAVDPEQPIDGTSGPWTLSEWVAERTEGQRLLAAIGNTLAFAALLLAAIGLYGLLSYNVTRRTFEIGVRMALGATRGGVLALVLRQTMRLAFAGVVLGLVAAAFLTRYLASLLFGIAPFDAVTFVLAGVGFLTVSLVAAILPARRAMAVSPVVALRTE